MQVRETNLSMKQIHLGFVTRRSRGLFVQELDKGHYGLIKCKENRRLMKFKAKLMKSPKPKNRVKGDGEKSWPSNHPLEKCMIRFFNGV